MTTYYAAVEDDPLTSGDNSRVHTNHKVGTIEGEDGRRRRIAFIGDPAWCAACNTMGVIIGGAPVPTQRRMLDVANGGRRQAVDGDEVACKCVVHPRIIAIYGRKFKITVVTASDRAPVATPAMANDLSVTIFDEQFVLRDTRGQPLPETYYSIRLPSGALRHGVTDSQGRTSRYRTDRAKSISIHLGHLRDAQ
ncbi:PAAR domain-containing protein [Paraburkholderia caffeinilytica]|uniref:PAAR domain-containing protein n=1 Tax=Paraburkholderia caffeinilytica TaxID=1761016 RepID=UPI0038B70BBF